MLSRYGQVYLSDFFETLSQLGLPSTVLTAIARVGLFVDLFTRAHKWTIACFTTKDTEDTD